jgi:Ca-activated chloride channel homolog
MLRWRIASTFMCLGLIGLVSTVPSGTSLSLGQGVLMDEAPRTDERWQLPRPRPDRPSPPISSYTISELSVQASIQNQLAETQVTQTFRNTGSRQIEARFVFPIPYEGAIDQMTFLVDGQEFEAKLLPADEARRIYQGYLQRNQDPALVQWLGTGMFQTSVFPIPVGASRTVTLRYSQLLRRDGNLTDYLFPLSTARYTSLPIEKLSIRVALAESEEIKNVYSPTHELEIKRDDARNVVVTGQWTNMVPNTDLRLVYDVAVGPLTASVLSTWPQEEEQGYFVLLARPTFDLQAVPPQQKNVVFVVDQSGSMSGEKIQQAREAAKFVLQNLRPNDHFNIISYHSTVQMLSPEPLVFNDQSRSQAMGFVNGIHPGGMTNIDEALTKAFTTLPDNALPSYLVFLTDGLPTVGEKNEMKIAASCRRLNHAKARMISFGVGFDVNSRLLDRLSRDHRGQSEYVLPNEDLEAAVARLYSKISTPVVTNMVIDFNGEGYAAEQGPLIDRVYPRDHNELYAGNQLVLIGRYRQGGQVRVKIKGRVGDKDQEFDFDLKLSTRGENSKFPLVSKLWAMRRIGELIDEIDLEGKNSELVNELTALSLKHGIVTPFTSYLADENSVPLADMGGQRGLTAQGLQTLAEVSGEAGVSGRSFKQSNKLAENLMGLEQRNSAQSLRGPGSTTGGLSASGQSLPPRMSRLGRENRPTPSANAGPGALGDAPERDGQNARSTSLSGLRKVGSWTLYKRGNLLIADNAVDVDLEKADAQIQTIKRFSSEWQTLLSDNTPAENLLLAEQQPDEELIVRLREVVYRIQ